MLGRRGPLWTIIKQPRNGNRTSDFFPDRTSLDRCDNCIVFRGTGQVLSILLSPSNSTGIGDKRITILTCAYETYETIAFCQLRRSCLMNVKVQLLRN